MTHVVSGGRQRLDQFVLDIEFLLISVVQGVALAALAGAAIGPISDLQYQYWLYIISAFLVIIIFWSQAIIHALSFIDWPLDLMHNFLYFLASFVEVLSFSKMTDPVHWFGFISALFVVAGILYLVDLKLIKARQSQFSQSSEGEKLYTYVYHEHMFELKVLVPAGLIFNLAAFWLVRTYPNLFLDHNYHLILIVIQVLFEMVVLVNAIKSFKIRSNLITHSVT